MHVILHDIKENPKMYKDRTEYSGTFSCVCLDTEDAFIAKFKGLRESAFIINEAVKSLKHGGIKQYRYDRIDSGNWYKISPA
jgi:hypothetical protein